MQIDVADVQLVEPSEEGIEQEGIGFEVGFGIGGREHFFVNVEGAVEEELAAAAESDDGVVEGEGDVAGAGDDLLNEGFGVAVAAAGDELLDEGEVGEGGVGVVSLLRGPAEDVEGEVGVGLGLQGLGHVGGGEARFQAVDPCLELFLGWGFAAGGGGGGLRLRGCGGGGSRECRGEAEHEQAFGDEGHFFLTSTQARLETTGQ